MWFHPHAEELYNIRSTPSKSWADGIIADVDGVRWRGATTQLGTSSAPVIRGGAWSDQGIHLGWDTMCVNHEKDLFLKWRGVGWSSISGIVYTLSTCICLVTCRSLSCAEPYRESHAVRFDILSESSCVCLIFCQRKSISRLT